ncbi:hypothetical protein Dimus_002649 [Dionaea muscipula]
MLELLVVISDLFSLELIDCSHHSSSVHHHRSVHQIDALNGIPPRFECFSDLFIVFVSVHRSSSKFWKILQIYPSLPQCLRIGFQTLNVKLIKLSMYESGEGPIDLEASAAIDVRILLQQQQQQLRRRRRAWTSQLMVGIGLQWEKFLDFAVGGVRSSLRSFFFQVHYRRLQSYHPF